MMVLAFTVGLAGYSKLASAIKILRLGRAQELDELDGVVTMLGMLRDPGPRDVDVHATITLDWARRRRPGIWRPSPPIGPDSMYW